MRTDGAKAAAGHRKAAKSLQQPNVKHQRARATASRATERSRCARSAACASSTLYLDVTERDLTRLPPLIIMAREYIEGFARAQAATVVGDVYKCESSVTIEHRFAQLGVSALSETFEAGLRRPRLPLGFRQNPHAFKPWKARQGVFRCEGFTDKLANLNRTPRELTVG